LRFTVKLGGSLLDEAAIRTAILSQVAELAGAGHEIVLVHGGGKNLTRRLAQLGIESRFVDGLRVTDESTLEVAVMVLAGEVNKRLVAELAGAGARGFGLCGADGGAVRSTTLLDRGPIGRVGRAVSVAGEVFDMLLARGLVPVVSSLALAEDGGLHNVNADQMAAACAWGTRSKALVYLTDVPGVRGAEGEVVRRLGRREIESLRASGVISGGMLPKTLSCLEALHRGIPSVYILPGAGREILKRFIEDTLEEGSVIHADE
jgi:acetylglutamate kinase